MYDAREKKIALSKQEPDLLSGTIIDNILFGVNEYSHEDLNFLIEKFKVNIDRFINDEVTIGEGTTDISGGEKLKLSLIRAFLKTPELLILDEPTSALDLESIKVLKELIVKGKSNRITIVITHDTKIMDIADEYVKLTKT